MSQNKIRPNKVDQKGLPVDKGSLGVHKVEFVVDATEHLSNRRGVGDHAHRPLHLEQEIAGSQTTAFQNCTNQIE